MCRLLLLEFIMIFSSENVLLIVKFRKTVQILPEICSFITYLSSRTYNNFLAKCANALTTIFVNCKKLQQNLQENTIFS